MLQNVTQVSRVTEKGARPNLKNMITKKTFTTEVIFFLNKYPAVFFKSNFFSKIGGGLV